MTTRTPEDKAQLDRRALTVAAVIGSAGALLMSVGAAIAGLSLLATGRRWVGQMDPPPRDQARRRADQLRAATSAGVTAWKDSAPTT